MSIATDDTPAMPLPAAKEAPPPPPRLPRRMRRIYSLEDLEPAARRFLPRPIFGYVEGGAETNASRGDARAAFEEIGLVPRILVDVSSRSLATELMGERWEMPFGIAPMGVSALTGYRGDLSLARAAEAAGIPMVISAASLIPLEEIRAAAPRVWYQAYLPREEEEILALLARVERAGIGTLVVTVDTAVVPSRENNLRTGYKTPLKPNLSLLLDGLTHPAWAAGTFLRTFLRHGNPHFENAGPGRGAPLLSRQAVRDFSGREFLDWDMLHRVRARWKGRLVLKGLLHPGDVALAREAGCDAVVLSSHGGRQLDYAISPLRVLAAAKAVSGGMPLMLDSGIRRGTDILKAFGLGADFVFLGRPMNYASALGGEAGVAHAIGLMRTQLRADLGMMGLLSMAEMGPGQLLHDGFRQLPG
ncbi:alpha-hydroxy acid oxidase [Poseidonocella sp. HB161398]|uniref:alpha-hydroxy acid oxidase n=1 Tax=Poseidonocella sp. HB161398 TaxID=2320855 RepID=UPI0011099017|nr:alpha-hydroxy acid oxidase [Poseidonocella sp. HB161398]